MTQTVKNRWSVAYEILKSVASGLALTLLIGIYSIEKTRYDWEHSVDVKLAEHDKNFQDQSGIIANVITKQGQQDQKQSNTVNWIAQLYGRFRIPFNQN